MKYCSNSYILWKFYNLFNPTLLTILSRNRREMFQMTVIDLKDSINWHFWPDDLQKFTLLSKTQFLWQTDEI